MGANASTAVPLYASGQVLDAARLNLTNAGVPVFSGTATRDAAFGGSGEKVLAEGQLCYLEDANVVQYYDGASFATVGPATPTPSALTFITGTTYSAVTSVSLPTNTFTSTYDNYRVLFQFTASAGCDITMRLRAAGSDLTASSYYYGFSNTLADNILVTKNGSAVNTVGIIANAGTGNQGFINMDLYFPQAAKQTGFNGQGLHQASGSTNIGVLDGGGGYFATTSADSLSFIASAGTLTGQYKVYAYANS